MVKLGILKLASNIPDRTSSNASGSNIALPSIAKPVIAVPIIITKIPEQ